MKIIKDTPDEKIVEDNKSSKFETPSTNETLKLVQAQSKASTSKNSNRIKPKSIGDYILGIIFGNNRYN